MTEHDWRSHLSPFEKSRIRFEERETERKEKELESIRSKRGWDKTKQSLELQIAGHRFMRMQLVNRGTQRAKLGIEPKKRKQDRRITHVERMRA